MAEETSLESIRIVVQEGQDTSFLYEMVTLIPRHDRLVPRWLENIFEHNEMTVDQVVMILMRFLLTEIEKAYARRYGIKLLEMDIEDAEKFDFVIDTLCFMNFTFSPRESFAAICKYLRKQQTWNDTEPENTYIYPEEYMNHGPWLLTPADFEVVRSESSQVNNTEE